MPPAESSGGGIRCTMLRGGTSKGAYFVAGDLPMDEGVRDDLVLRVMGSPDPAQIDGIGGAHPLTSKVAIVSASDAADVDLDYLFLQVGVDAATVSTTQTCGNLLAGVAPFALQRGLIDASGERASVRIRLLNTGDLATVSFAVSGGRYVEEGDTRIDGVPGTGGRIDIEVRGGADKPLLPTGNVVDEFAGHRATVIDNGMPVVLLDAAEFGVEGDESPAALEADDALRAAVEEVRLLAGARAGLGDVATQTVPKMILLSPPRSGGAVGVRAFIPARVHTSIGVLMAASVAAGVRIPGAVGADIATLAGAEGDAGVGEGDAGGATLIEHPTGTLESSVRVWQDAAGVWRGASESVRTARILFDGVVFPRARS